MRIAVVNPDRCKPNLCNQECKNKCPVVKIGKHCVIVSKKDKTAIISEELCNGCNICTKACPFNAIQIINLPKELTESTIHRYGQNSFKLIRLPTPRLGQVLGLIGPNGVGKSTALKILANKLTPNLGDFSSPPDWRTILSYFRGSELQNYFKKLLEDEIVAFIKPQYVDRIPQMIKDKNAGVRDLLPKTDKLEEVLDKLDLKVLYEKNRNIGVLSGGELQRFAIAMICLKEGNVYMFDEPSSYLDIKQRLNAGSCIRSLLKPDNYVICVEHDLALLDYLSDFVCCLYGSPGGYGIVTLPYNTRDGINIFLDGFIPTENMRFRETSLSFNFKNNEESVPNKKKYCIKYESTKIVKSGFELDISEGDFNQSEIIVLLGQNGMGKTTFLEHLYKLSNVKYSYKPQVITPSFNGTVRELLQKKTDFTSEFMSDILKPLQVDELMDFEVQNLSGGELQRVAISVCLGKKADVYLLDEPSAYLDSEQRINASKAIKRFIMNNKKTALIVEHDFIMSTYLADRVIYYDGIPSVKGHAHSPESLVTGMNKFLQQLDVTFRRDPSNGRPRINKHDSVKDTEQKISGNYFFLE